MDEDPVPRRPRFEFRGVLGSREPWVEVWAEEHHRACGTQAGEDSGP
ncbi:MAG: hypothetical protein LPK38_06960 [Actinomycetes bacterium]|nr:hypothetical protein [Actinomycetes bacterium]MDX5381027.1 hypothetical protein [Actinomycetes bacterium]MDX5400195.1 hypothetical protein [Actinomycetes bacterium]MDX5450781.1 hypothetical protein [Actinomycetes bacterium]